MSHSYNHCPNCATPLRLLTQIEDGGPKERLRCPACGWTHWNNPIPVLAAIIEMAGQRRRSLGPPYSICVSRRSGVAQLWQWL